MVHVDLSMGSKFVRMQSTRLTANDKSVWGKSNGERGSPGHKFAWGALDRIVKLCRLQLESCLPGAHGLCDDEQCWLPLYRQMQLAVKAHSLGRYLVSGNRE